MTQQLMHFFNKASVTHSIATVAVLKPGYKSFGKKKALQSVFGMADNIATLFYLTSYCMTDGLNKWG